MLCQWVGTLSQQLLRWCSAFSIFFCFHSPPTSHSAPLLFALPNNAFSSVRSENGTRSHVEASLWLLYVYQIVMTLSERLQFPLFCLLPKARFFSDDEQQSERRRAGLQDVCYWDKIIGEKTGEMTEIMRKRSKENPASQNTIIVKWGSRIYLQQCQWNFKWFFQAVYSYILYVHKAKRKIREILKQHLKEKKGRQKWSACKSTKSGPGCCLYDETITKRKWEMLQR